MKSRIAASLFAAALAGLACACAESQSTSGSYSNATMNVSSPTPTRTPADNTQANANTHAVYNPLITKEEYEKDKARYEREAEEKGERVGNDSTDGWLWVKTKGKLASAEDLHDSTVKVDVNAAMVTLRGEVETPTQKAKVEAMVKSIEGVKSVENLLQVQRDIPTTLPTPTATPKKG